MTLKCNVTIYKIHNKINKKVYIGSTINFNKRISDHKISCKNLKTKFYDAIKEYGWENFEVSIIEVCCILIRNCREQYWIDMFNSMHAGYNSTVAEQILMTEETRQKISSKNKGKTPWNKGIPRTKEEKEKISKSCAGKKISSETKEKISKSLSSKKRKPLSEEHKKKISLANKGKHLSPAQIEKHKISMSERKGRPNYSRLGKKMSNSQKEELIKSLTGRKHSEETKKKISESNKGKHETSSFKRCASGKFIKKGSNYTYDVF